MKNQIPSHDIQRTIAEVLRTESKVVDAYLDYAKRYADLTRRHAETLCQEIWPCKTSKLQLYANLPLQTNNPEQLKRKLDAIMASPDAANVREVIVCPATLTVYVFGLAK